MHVYTSKILETLHQIPYTGTLFETLKAVKEPTRKEPPKRP